MEKIQVEILGLSSSPSAGGAYALLLKESFGNRRLPIIIGAFEAQAIALELEGIKPPRPLTHDLLKTLVDNLGASIKEVVIDELTDNTFFAKILLDVSTLSNVIDSRPSDAIALAVRTGCPIYVSAEVMRVASFIPSSDIDDVEPGEPLDEPPQTEKKPSKSTKQSKLATLQNQLREAIEKEDYERAAKLRDEISLVKGNN
ncbi:MAG: bifunctional nuclease family protein [Melioribacteraceae bacterium]|nr:bifunctional nuclease family protein [Melioribacteraceae bacterium]MCF8355531.1 bifunctional nuclease family protein [Melioribacteraceae bacterium]MCF8394514.1 bifunctional nuclease family protein [Melioribacteraceae bacterium]MCF8420130.1 bifunctional nuclease family protein [Melioribacteraceae bacterium]